MLRQIRYFQAVVRNHSFSEAAVECHISQSAISQQIKALENELGFLLLERKNRKFILTPAGEHFYKKSLVLLADYEQLCNESARIARGDEVLLKLGYPRSYGGKEVPLALEEFSAKYPRISVQILYGDHEELFELLRREGIDLAFSDQRRAFSDEYVNRVMTASHMYIEVSSRNAIAGLSSITTQELKNFPCILVSSKEQWETEQDYYRTVIGLQGGFLRAENLEEARLLVISGQGFLPVEGDSSPPASYWASICRIPLFRGSEPVIRNYCLFWKKSNSGYYTEEFAEILKRQFDS